MKWCVLYLASPKDRIVEEANARKIDILRASLRITRRCFPNVDIYVFHEDYTDQEFALCPEVTKFIQVDFETGSEHYVKHAFPKGYMMMCRFFSGVVQKHPILNGYTHYMRLDDDSYFMDPVPTEPYITSLIEKDYVYRSLFYDLKDHQSLYEFTIEFLKSNGYGHHIPMLETYLKQKGILNKSGKYTGIAPYNNFHLSSIRLWEHPFITRYIELLETEHYILKRGWLDANIHSMIVFVLAPFIGMHVHFDGTFGYRHNRHISWSNNPAISWDASLPFHPQFSDLPKCL